MGRSFVSSAICRRGCKTLRLHYTGGSSLSCGAGALDRRRVGEATAAFAVLLPGCVQPVFFTPSTTEAAVQHPPLAAAAAGKATTTGGNRRRAGEARRGGGAARLFRVRETKEGALEVGPQ